MAVNAFSHEQLEILAKAGWLGLTEAAGAGVINISTRTLSVPRLPSDFPLRTLKTSIAEANYVLGLATSGPEEAAEARVALIEISRAAYMEILKDPEFRKVTALEPEAPSWDHRACLERILDTTVSLWA